MINYDVNVRRNFALPSKAPHKTDKEWLRECTISLKLPLVTRELEKMRLYIYDKH